MLVAVRIVWFVFLMKRRVQPQLMPAAVCCFLACCMLSSLLKGSKMKEK